MVARRAAADHLSAVPLFSSLSKRDLQQVGKATTEVRIDAGQTLVEQGRTGQEFFLILDGEAEVRRNDRRLTTLGPGDYFGELAILDRGPRSASVIAKTDMAVLVLSQRDFVGVLASVPEMALKLLTVMAQRLREADTKAHSH
jgi:CRP-like cAMP-binding protein